MNKKFKELKRKSLDLRSQLPNPLEYIKLCVHCREDGVSVIADPNARGKPIRISVVDKYSMKERSIELNEEEALIVAEGINELIGEEK